MPKAFLERDDVDRMEAAARSLRDRLLVRLMHRLGGRVSEIISIEVPNVDAVRLTVTIEHLKTRLHSSCPKYNAALGRRHSYCPKCGEQVVEAVALARQHKRMRVLPVDEDTMRMVTEYIVSGGPVERGGKRLLFGISRHRAWQIVRDCARRAGIPDLVNPEAGRSRGVSPRRLRDAFAVNAMKKDDSGDGLRLLQEHLGHSSFNTTARYRKVAGEEHRSWYAGCGRSSASPNERVRQQARFCHYFATGRFVNAEGYVSPDPECPSQRSTRKPGRPRAVPEELMPAVVDLYQRDNGYRRIASILEREHGVLVHYASVKRALKRIGVIK